MSHRGRRASTKASVYYLQCVFMYRLTHKTISRISHDHLPDNQSVLLEINFRQRDRFWSDRLEINRIIDKKNSTSSEADTGEIPVSSIGLIPLQETSNPRTETQYNKAFMVIKNYLYFINSQIWHIRNCAINALWFDSLKIQSNLMEL